MTFSYATDIGKVREKNEDSAMILTNAYGDVFMMVFDGMGGHNQGDIAANLAQSYLCKKFKQKDGYRGKMDMKFWLKKALKSTNRYLNEYHLFDEQSKGMGTTFACYLIHGKHVLMGYIGDTRAYLIKDGGIHQNSTDETYVQFLYESGKITKEEMATHPSRHVVTNALGCYPTVIINTGFIRDPFDYLLLCSDGLYNMVKDHKICSVIEENGSDVEKSICDLIDLANRNGGRDNIAIAIYCGKETPND